MTKLSTLPNIGPVLEQELNKLHIFTVNDFMKWDTKNLFIELKLIDNDACLHKLYALAGAKQNIKKSLLTNKQKDDLRTFYHSLG